MFPPAVVLPVRVYRQLSLVSIFLTKRWRQVCCVGKLSISPFINVVALWAGLIILFQKLF